jgi:RNA polymerase sigma factor (sigma-70 family)
MNDVNDMDLLREYLDRNSQEAFAGLVQRHINLVHSVATRCTGDAHEAQDVTQAVFIILAQKAAGLRHRTNLTGWLYETTRLTSRQALRTTIRRRTREHEAFMQSDLNDTTTENVWQQLAPYLEEAMGKLSERDRALVALRFFENKSFAETSSLLGIQEWAARKRVERITEKLRAFFSRRGVLVPAAALTAAIAENSVQAAPMSLAKTVTAAAMTKGVAASSSTVTLAKGALKVMAWTKVKTALIIGAGILLATGSTGLAIHHYRQPASGPLSQDAWRNVGLATPEAALQTSFAAMSKGDVNGLNACYTTEFKNQFMETAGKGKSEAELSAMFVKIAGMIGSFQITDKETVPDGGLIVHFRAGRMGAATVPMTNVNGEWRINGNIVSVQPRTRNP